MDIVEGANGDTPDEGSPMRRSAKVRVALVAGCLVVIAAGVALYFFQQHSAAQKEAEREYVLGSNLMIGPGIAVDPEAALKHFRAAADAGNAGAMTNLGLMYQQGCGVPQDDAIAFSWFEKAANAGDSMAMANLALIYMNGRGVKMDTAKARDWAQKAYNAGNTDGTLWRMQPVRS